MARRLKEHIKWSSSIGCIQDQPVPVFQISTACTTLVLRNDRKYKNIFMFPEMNSAQQRLKKMLPIGAAMHQRKKS